VPRRRPGVTLDVTVSRGMRLRRIAAIVLLAAVAAFWLAALVSALLRPSTIGLFYVGPAWVAPLQHGLAFSLVLAAIVGLARSWWWARMWTFSLAFAALAQVFINYLSFPSVRELSLVTGWAAALLVCLAGRRFRAHHEARTAGLDWEAPGMGVLWWAIVLNGATMVLLPLKLIAAWQISVGCFGPHHGPIDHQAPAYWPSVLVAGLLLVGLLLLARQKTAGLLLTASASVALPLVLAQTLRESFSLFDARMELLPAVPGLLAAWLALGVWARPLWRLLRS
jgi:hypothetical protein